jgi:hypothetical protein
LNQYNEFAGGYIVFSSNPVCICALCRIKIKYREKNKLMYIAKYLRMNFSVCSAARKKVRNAPAKKILFSRGIQKSSL